MAYYKCEFRITPDILKNISAIESSKAIIESSPLLPLYERQFKKDALIRSAHFGTAVEGNNLDIGGVRKIIDGRGKEVIGKKRDIQEVINYRKVIDYIENYKNTRISTDTILKLNAIITENLVDDMYRGRYRHTQNYFANLVTGEVLFTPPKEDEVAALMEDFIAFLYSKDGMEMHPVLRAGICHDRIVSIHPFVDGNGRCARACATLLLYLEGYDIKKFFCLEEHYDQDVLSYYKAIAEGHKDLTKWLEYFSKGLAIELEKIKERVIKLSQDAKIKKVVGQIYLSEREEKIIDWLNNYGRFQNKDFRTLFPDISEDTVLRDLKELINKKIVIKRGRTKSARYELKR